MKNTKRTTSGQFKTGTSGNPSGRPAGNRNKATLACEQLLGVEAEELIQALVKKAKEGNIQALGMCLDRLLPARKERCIRLEPRPIATLQDLPIHYQDNQDITSAVAEGRITPGEGESLSNTLTSHVQAMERVNLDRRVGELEAEVPEIAAYRREMARFVENSAFGNIQEGRKE